ncbi:MAG: YeeE/YedE family protein [Halocynthiibacter sp.]
METEFTPYAALIGGGLIGLASVLLMAFHGRIFGASGLLSGLVFPASSSDWSWRAVLFVGMLMGPLAYFAIFAKMPDISMPIGRVPMMIGGFIVGIGVTLGSGCTSGHGVCGMARLSPRSIVATVTFMIFTALTVYIVRHVVGVAS